MSFSFLSRARRFLPAAALATAIAPAFAEGLSEVVPADPASPEFAMALRVAESLGAPPPSALSTADLDNDGFPEFLVSGEGGMRIYRLGARDWTEISGGALAGASLGDVAVLPERFNGFPVLRFGGAEFAVAAGAYRPRGEIEPKPLDASAFTPACEKAEAIILDLTDNGAPADEAPAYCACLLDQWQAREAGQATFDVYARELAGIFRVEDRDEPHEADTLFATIDETRYACRTARGWPAELPMPFGTPLFDGQPRSPAANAFAEVCRAQDWVLANDKIGSAARALGFCGCMAVTLARNGMSEAGFTLVSGLYSGEMSENDVSAEDPSAIGASDEASEVCLGTMPWR